MKGTVQTSPFFFRRIAWAGIAFSLVLLLGGEFVPAPLDEPANPAMAPNPAKSAWFLLWIQEIVSYTNDMMLLVLFLAGWLVALPYMPLSPTVEKARWFPREQVVVNVFTLILLCAVLTLTVIAAFFRGEDWKLVLPG